MSKEYNKALRQSIINKHLQEISLTFSYQEIDLDKLKEIKQTAFKLQALVRALPQKEKDALKFQGLLGSARDRLTAFCMMHIFAINKIIKKKESGLIKEDLTVGQEPGS